jgi:hypothetical protein
VQFKSVHTTEPVYSARITREYRVVGIKEDDAIVWFWAGPTNISVSSAPADQSLQPTGTRAAAARSSTISGVAGRLRHGRYPIQDKCRES